MTDPWQQLTNPQPTTDGTVVDNILGDMNLSATVLFASNTPPTTVGEALLAFDYMDVNDPVSWNMYRQILADRGYSTDSASVLAQAKRAALWASDGYNQGKSIFDFFVALPPSGNPAGGPKSQTQRVVNLSNRGDAAATLNNAYQQMLGRMASDKEIKAFQKALNDLEGKNPSVTSTSSVNDGSNASYSTKSSGGFNASQFAADWAMSRPEYAETFAATTFMDVVENLVNSGPSLEGRVSNG